MAVIEIAKILVRRGQELITGTPNLDPGEFGWAEDTQNLYIGKRISEGADSDAPTRVLTQPDLDNIFAAIGNITTATTSSLYNYRIENDYLSHNTVSNLQIKLDSINPTIYDFGAPVSSSPVDITLELQGAIRDLYKNENLGQNLLGSDAQDLRRQLILPAGSFIVNSTVELPPYASITGMGPDKTRITFENTATSLFQTVDLYGNRYEDGDMQSGAIRAREVYIGNMTLSFSKDTSGNNALISIDNVQNARIENCVLKSDLTSTFDNHSTTAYTIPSTNLVTFYTDILDVNYFAGQQLIASYDDSNFIRGEVVSYNTSTGELVLSSDSSTQQFGSGSYSDWSIRVDEYFSPYGFSIHGVGLRLRGTGGGIGGDVNLCENIVIKDCTFDGLATGVEGTGSVVKILIENNLLNNLNKGIHFLDSDSIVAAPTNGRIINNRFQNIIQEGLYVGSNKDNKPTYHTSEGNTYFQVGNGTDLTDAVTVDSTCTSVIKFVATGNKSANDYFSRRAEADQTTDPAFYYYPIISGNAVVRDESIDVKTILAGSSTPISKLYLANTDQKLDINYQMTGNGLSRKGALLVNIAPDGFVSFSDYYNYSQTVQTLENPFYVTDYTSTNTFTVKKTPSTEYIDQVNAGGNWYIVAVDDPNVSGQVGLLTTATSTGTPYSLGDQYYSFTIIPAPTIDFTSTGTLYDFAYSDFTQPTFFVNTASIGTTTNYALLEVVSPSVFDMSLEYRTDQQI